LHAGAATTARERVAAVVRWLVRAAAIIVIVVAALVVLDFAELVVPVEPDDTASMATTIPGCKGRVLAQGLTYRLSDPSQGDIVAVHAAETDAGQIVPDKDADDRTLVLRVAAGPGDTIVGRDGTVFVNDVKFDDITTKPFREVKVPNEQYFLLGDNRSAAVDSRTFGPVLGNAIFAKVFAVYWPLRDIAFSLGQFTGAPPGRITCD
jgi:signal peptidase I